MKIVVNGETTDEFGRPRGDQTLGSFLEELNQQLGQTNRVVSQIIVDDRPYTEEMDSRACSGVDRLEIEIVTLEDLTIESIGELGEYCHRYLNRLPNILEEWEQVDVDTLHTYREQVLEALDGSNEILRSIDSLTNLADQEQKRENMARKALNLREQLDRADLDRSRELLKGEIRGFFEDLLETLQNTLDQFEQRQEHLVEETVRVHEQCDVLLEEIHDFLDGGSENGSDLSDSYDLETSHRLAERLTDVNKVIAELDEAGTFKTAFPSDDHDEVKRTLKELREGIPRVLTLINDHSSDDIRRVLKKDIVPHVRRTKDYLETVVDDQEVEKRNADNI